MATKTAEDLSALAHRIASAAFTEAGRCSVECSVNPPYWNRDAEEDVVRTPLSDESRGCFVSTSFPVRERPGHIPLPR